MKDVITVEHLWNPFSPFLLPLYLSGMMLDHVGWLFIPLYRLFGPLSMLFILLIFLVGLVQLSITLVFRTVGLLGHGV